MSGTPQQLSEAEYHQVDRYGEVGSFTARERLAIEFAERFALHHTEIDRAFFERLRAEYTDAEIVELAGTIAFCLGIGRVFTVLDIANECPVVH